MRNQIMMGLWLVISSSVSVIASDISTNREAVARPPGSQIPKYAKDNRIIKRNNNDKIRYKTIPDPVKLNVTLNKAAFKKAVGKISPKFESKKDWDGYHAFSNTTFSGCENHTLLIEWSGRFDEDIKYDKNLLAKIINHGNHLYINETTHKDVIYSNFEIEIFDDSKQPNMNYPNSENKKDGDTKLRFPNKLINEQPPYYGDEFEGDMGYDGYGSGFESTDPSNDYDYPSGGDDYDYPSGGDDFDYPSGGDDFDYPSGGDDFDYPSGGDDFDNMRSDGFLRRPSYMSRYHKRSGVLNLGPLEGVVVASLNYRVSIQH